MFDVVALGESLIDFTPNGTNAQGIELFARNPGGAPANVLAMNARLGGKTAFIGKVGKDGFGDFLRQTLVESSIDVSGLVIDEKIPTTLAFVQLDSKGDRSFTFYRNPGADVMLTSAEVNRNLIDDAAIFHFGSVSLTADPSRTATLEAARYARQQGKLVSFDPNYKSSRIIFRFDEAAIYDSLLRDYAVPLPLPAIKESLLQSSSGGLTELFSKALLKNPSDFAKGVFLAVAQKRMEDARKEVLDICYDKAAVTLAGMTGLGMGLTPSGDDFLCGVLAGLLFSGQWDHPFAQALRQTISRRLGDTNDISRTFLSCALSCHFSRPVKELPLASGTTEILSSFGAIGHSSGFDTLCGIYYGYTLCLGQEDVPGK